MGYLQGSQISEITERKLMLTTSFTLKIFTDEKQNKETKQKLRHVFGVV